MLLLGVRDTVKVYEVVQWWDSNSVTTQSWGKYSSEEAAKKCISALQAEMPNGKFKIKPLQIKHSWRGWSERSDNHVMSDESEGLK